MPDCCHIGASLPSKLSSKRFKLPWFNRELKHLCRKKARKYKKAKRSGREDHWEQYKEFQKVVQAKLTEGRWDYINRFLQIGLETRNKTTFLEVPTGTKAGRFWDLGTEK